MFTSGNLTPTQQDSAERSRRFRAHIDEMAEKLRAPADIFITPPAPIVSPAPVVAPINEPSLWFYPANEKGEPLPVSLMPSIQKIQQAACAYFQVRRADMVSSRRPKEIVRARQIAMFIAKDLTMASLPQIGRRFGGRDHTTVLFAVRKINRLLPLDLGTAFDVAAITYSLIGDQPQ